MFRPWLVYCPARSARLRIARERRDKIIELHAKVAALQSSQRKERSLVEILRDKSERSRPVPSPEFLEFVRQVDRRIMPD
jgi:hypothetical protein